MKLTFEALAFLHSAAQVEIRIYFVDDYSNIHEIRELLPKDYEKNISDRVIDKMFYELRRKLEEYQAIDKKVS